MCCDSKRQHNLLRFWNLSNCTTVCDATPLCSFSIIDTWHKKRSTEQLALSRCPNAWFCQGWLSLDTIPRYLLFVCVSLNHLRNTQIYTISLHSLNVYTYGYVYPSQGQEKIHAMHIIWML